MRAVFLTGPGGVGKTTIARATQHLLHDDWLHFEVDKCQPHSPPRPGFATMENERRMVRASLRAAYAYVEIGFPTVIEMDMTNDWRRQLSEEVFGGVPTLLVTLTANRDVALERMRARGTEPQYFEWFERYYDRIDWSALPSSLTIDTTDVTPDAAAGQLADFVEATPTGAAARPG